MLKNIDFPMNKKFRALSFKKRHEANTSLHGDSGTKSPDESTSSHGRKSSGNEQELQISKPVLLSRTTSRISHSPSPSLSKCATNKGNTTPPLEFVTTTYVATPSAGNTPSTLTSPIPTPTTTTSTTSDPTFLSKTASLRSTAPIFFSQSAARKKPPPIEKKILCSLEELCNGCVKKIKITRDAISSNGLIVQEEEILIINIKPGWKKGTKITFEGKGDERPGTLPADIIFVIDEKKHLLFKREGDDLELGVKVPLIQALTGCTMGVPLLGGGQMTLYIDDIIHPGYEKIIQGQGMPKSKEGGRRGDLRLKFLVEFPPKLNDEQRSEIVSILQDGS